MPFDPLAWALGYTLTSSTKWLIGRLFRDDLEEDLRREVLSWSKSLPPGSSVHPAALFTTTHREEEGKKRPAWSALHKAVENHEVPSAKQWRDALFEQWLYVRSTISDPQPFFMLEECEATGHLEDLARRLHKVCAHDEGLFKSSVIGTLSNLNERVEELLRRRPEEASVRWRGLDFFNYPLPPVLPVLERNLGTVMITQLHHVFAQEGYTEFSVLMREQKVTSPFGEVPLVSLITHQARYLGAIRSILQTFLNPDIERSVKKAVQDRLESQRLELLEGGWATTINLKLGETERAHRLKYDPDSRMISILSVPHEETDPSRLPGRIHSTSELLLFISHVLRNNILLLNLDSALDNPSLLKLFLNLLDGKGVDYESIRVQVGNPERWDYLNPEIEAEIAERSGGNEP